MKSHLVDSDIGSWVRRVRKPSNSTPRDHFLQSVVAGGAITYCGRRLGAGPWWEFMVSDVPRNKCRVCPDDPRQPGEDDGSTVEEMVP